MLIKTYNLFKLSAKILEGKTFDTQRNWQLNWAVFSKAIELEIEKTLVMCLSTNGERAENYLLLND